MNKKYIYFLFIFLLLFTSCKKKTRKVQTQAFPVQVATSIQKDALIYVETIGHVDPFYKIDIRSRVEGEILQVFFKEGNDVNKGDLLFVIDPKPYQAAFEKAKATLNENMSLYNLAKDTLYRNRTLIKDEYISQLDYDNLITNVKKYQAIVDQNIADVENAKINLDYCSIYSPTDGIAGIINIDKGNLVAPNSTTALVTINKISPTYVLFSIPENQLPSLIKYHNINPIKVRVSFNDFTKDFIEGDLNLIDNEVDQNVGMIQIRGIFKNEDKRLWPSQFVKIRLILTTKKNTILIPYQAIQITPKGPQVFIVQQNNIVEMKQVKLGQREDDNIIIEQGVEQGEKVVIQGQINLSDKSHVFISKVSK